MEIKRLIFFTLGATFLGVGVIGIVIPVLPTTPLVLASFLCFSQSSKKAEKWISNNRYFGSYIENYKTKKGVPLDVKLKSILFLWVTLIASITLMDQYSLHLLLILVGVAVTAHILSLKTKDG
jgi:uncharacterized membrane protein YbaN (DUF454 family)